MKQSLEHLFIATHQERTMAGDTIDQAHAAALAAVHRAGMEDAAGIVAAQRKELLDLNCYGLDNYGHARKDAFDDIESAIRRAAGVSNG